MSDKVVIKVLGLAGMVMSGETLPSPDGQYIKGADVDAFDGRGTADLTADINEARVFDDVIEAHAFWTQVSTVKPVREDGRPNRPLTAFSVEILPLKA